MTSIFADTPKYPGLRGDHARVTVSPLGDVLIRAVDVVAEEALTIAMPDPIATDDLRRMDAARIGPHVTCPASRHAAMIAEDMAAGDHEQHHRADSIASTVASLWEARAEVIASRAREAELRAALIKADRMLVKVAARLPSAVVQKLPTKLLMEWEEAEAEVRAALSSQPDSGEA